jgi:NAD(P)-dependent dehydrogenase (short-subunit alcohol dehydrogenase family)
VSEVPVPTPDAFDLSGKVALVTGASKGIGRGIALALAAAGADVVVNGHRDLEAGQRVADEVRARGRRSVFFAADVTDPVAVQGLVDRTVAELGGLHVAVNNAMRPTGGRDLFDERALEAWPRAIEGYLGAPLYCCRAEAMHMRSAGGGSIVNIASTGGHRVSRGPLTVGRVAYQSGKAGLLHLTRVLASGWAPLGIRVNSVSPGFVHSASTERMEADPERMAHVRANTPMARMGHPDEVGGAVVYLASDAARFTTGADLVVDGGLITW